MTDTAATGDVRTQTDGHVLRIEVDNVAKKNAFTPDMMEKLSEAVDRDVLFEDIDLAFEAAEDAVEHLQRRLNASRLSEDIRTRGSVAARRSASGWSLAGLNETKTRRQCGKCH